MQNQLREACSVEDMRTPLDLRSKDFLLSLVLPVYNEEAAIPVFVETIRELFDGRIANYELVFVNDGSVDDSLDVLLSLKTQCSQIRIVNFARNFGKEAALTAGLDFARGSAVIPMDVDLQDPPEAILEFIKKWQEGFDVVNGRRVDRSQDGFSKRTTALGFYKAFNALGPVKIPENVGDFRLLDRCVIEAMQLLPERTRFMKGLFAWVGFKTTEVEFERKPRELGKTKFGYWRLWNFALDGIVNFSTAPLRVWTYCGVLVALTAFIYMGVIITKTVVFGVDSPGYASTVTLILFFGALQLLSIGVFGEYLSRVLTEVKARPIYIVSDTHN